MRSLFVRETPNQRPFPLHVSMFSVQGRVVSLLILVGLSGCLGGDEPMDEPAGVPSMASLRAHCDAADATPADSVCVNWITIPEAVAHFEPHLAAHPSDPESVLLSAMIFRDGGDLAPSTIHVMAGMTRDGGASWPLTSFHDAGLDDGAADDAPFLYDFAFDAVARFDGGGNPLVNFGGSYSGYRHPAGTGPLEQGQRQVLHWQMTLARSVDDAASWQYHAYHENPLLLEVDDYMDFDVGPDSGAFYVVTDSHGELDSDETAAAVYPFTIAFWRSTDDGETWESSALSSSPTRSEREFQFPRLAAGPQGLLVVTAQRFDSSGDDYEGVSAWISHDGGATFSEPVRVSDVPNTSQNGQHATIHGDRMDVVYGTASQAMHMVRSDDAGGTWDAPVELAAAVPGKRVVVWESAVDPATGDLYVLHKSADDDGTGFYLDLLRWDGVDVERIPLVDAPDAGTGGVFQGGHYAGLDVGVDGSVWVAWADPREDRYPIAVARLVPNP